jgi:hypothetical protein
LSKSVLLGVWMILLSHTAAFADTARICDQSVQYTPSESSPGLATELLSLSGRWMGGQVWSGILETCVGFVVERIVAPGTLHTQYAWSTAAGRGFNNTNKSGTTSWKATFKDGVLKFVGKSSGYELRMAGPNDLTGTYYNSQGTWTAWFKRQ